MINHRTVRLETRILSYLREVKLPCSVAQIRAAFDHGYEPSTIAQALYRAHERGLVNRVHHGVYVLSDTGSYESADDILVAGALDRLFALHGEQVDIELRRRGWMRRIGTPDD